MTQLRAVARRDEIVRAAAAEFNEVGYAAASLSSIAARLGRTKGAMSYHFSSKASLAREVAEHHFGEWDAVVASMRADGHAGLELVVLLAFVVAHRFRDDVVVRAGMLLQLDAGLHDVELPPPTPWWTGMTRELLVEAQSLGQLPAELDAGVAAEVLFEAYTGVQQISHRMSAAQDIHTRVENYWKVLLPGIGVTDPDELVKRLAELSARY